MPKIDLAGIVANPPSGATGSWGKGNWPKSWSKSWDVELPPPVADNLADLANDLLDQRTEAERAGAPDSLLATLDRAIAALHGLGGRPTSAEAAEPLPDDGRYGLANDLLYIELRLDIDGSNMVSGDIFAAAGGEREYLASFRSAPGVPLRRNQARIEIVGQDELGGRSVGALEIDGSAGENVKVELWFDQPLNHLGQRRQIGLIGRRVSSFLRELGIEISYERGVDTEIEFEFGDRTMTVEACLGAAGFDVSHRGITDPVPSPSDAWHDGDLHDLMIRYAQEASDRSAWVLQLLLLNRSATNGLLGVMFDTGSADKNQLPRQGAAIFVEPILRGYQMPKRKLIQTIVHELGHALNLAHRFERECGRADSKSFMNYDWKYLGGENESRFWRDFDFTFDSDELAFLRHGPWNSVIPGGAEFHSAIYWENLHGSYVPYQPEIPGREFALSIETPKNGGLFDFAQPVMLAVTLTNNTMRSMSLPDYLLDPKAGMLEIVVQKRQGRVRGGDGQVFRPIVNRCFDRSREEAGNSTLLAPGKAMSNNVNLFFGSTGFTFAEPGEYAVTAVLTLSWQNGRTLTYRSGDCRIRVAFPENRTDETNALDLFHWEVGHYVALGGSKVLKTAKERLRKIRQARPSNGKDAQIVDPLAATLWRARALELARPSVIYEHDKHKTDQADPAGALAILDRLDTVGEKAFDPVTLEETRKLKAELADAIRGPGPKA